MTLLDELHQAVATPPIASAPSVVGLGRGWARGSGVIVAPNRVLTAAHALRGDEVTVTFRDGRTATGRVTGADADVDVGVVEVDTADAPAVTWEPDAVGRLTIGAPVLALSNPGGHGLRATFGLVSATGRSFRGPRGRRIPGSVEHTAPLPRGSSGGPLVDPDGRLLGLNAVRREGGLILAVPADASPPRARRSAGPRRVHRAPAPWRRARPPARRSQDARRGRPPGTRRPARPRRPRRLPGRDRRSRSAATS